MDCSLDRRLKHFFGPLTWKSLAAPSARFPDLSKVACLSQYRHNSAYVCQDMPSAKGEAAMNIHFIIEFGLASWLFVVWRRADGPMGGHLLRLWCEIGRSDVRLTNLEARVTEIEKARTLVH